VLGKELAEPLLPVDSWLDVLAAERVVCPSKFNIRLAAGKLRFLIPSWVGTTCLCSLVDPKICHLGPYKTCREHLKFRRHDFLFYLIGSISFYGFGSRRPINYGFNRS
jgi:hypothetical protein